MPAINPGRANVNREGKGTGKRRVKRIRRQERTRRPASFQGNKNQPTQPKSRVVVSTPKAGDAPQTRKGDFEYANAYTRAEQLANSKRKAGDAPQDRKSDTRRANEFKSIPKAGDSPKNRAKDFESAEEYARKVVAEKRERRRLANRTQQEKHDETIRALAAQRPKNYAGIPGGKLFEEINFKGLRAGKHATLKTLEVTARPSHAVAGATNEVVKGHSALSAVKEAGKGITGKQTTSFSDVLKSAGVENKVIRAVAGFGLDVVTDPTTYVTLGASSVLRKGAEEAARSARVAARRAGASVEDQEKVANAARDHHYATSKDPTNKGLQVGARIPFTGKKVATSGKSTARVNRAVGGSAIAGKVRRARLSQGLGRSLDPNFRREGVPEHTHFEGRQAARRHRAHNDRVQEQAEHLRKSINRETGRGEQGRHAREDVMATVEKSPERGAIPDTHVQLENTVRHDAQIERNAAGRDREGARRRLARAEGRAVNEDRHAVAKRVMEPEKQANKARDRAKAQLGSAKGSASREERQLRKVVMDSDRTVAKLRDNLNAAYRERARLRTRYGNVARNSDKSLSTDDVLAGRARAMESLDKEITQLKGDLQYAMRAAESKPIPRKAEGQWDRTVAAGSKERDAGRVAADAEDVASTIRKDRSNRFDFERNRGVPAAHLKSLQTAVGDVKVAEGRVHAADKALKAAPPTRKNRELVRRVVGGFQAGLRHPQGSLLHGPKYADVRDTLPKQTSAHPELVTNLRARNQNIAVDELKRGKLRPAQVLTPAALAHYDRLGDAFLKNVRPSDIRDDYMHHELPEVITPVRTQGEARDKLKELETAINHAGSDLSTVAPGTAQHTRLTAELERLEHQKSEIERLRAGESPTAPMSAATGASQSFRKTREIQHSAREENTFRGRDARGRLFEEDAGKVQPHRELQSGQLKGFSDFVDSITSHGVPWKRGDKIPEGYEVYTRDASDHLTPLPWRDREKINLGLAKVPDGAQVLNKSHIDSLLSEAQRFGKIPSAWSRKVVAPWKVAYTVANVSYHVGNEIGNRVLAWMADVGPQSWAKSGHSLRLIRARNKFERKAGYSRGERFEDTGQFPTKTGYRNLDAKDKALLKELELAEKTGALRSGLHQEISNLRGKSPGVVRRFSERREMQARIAVWHQARDKEGLSPDQAADKVNKFLIDYGNLTAFEKHVRDVGIPFYTFWARNTRLQLSQLAQRPGKAATFQKAREDVAEAQQEDPEFANALQYYQQAATPFIIMMNGSPVMFYARTPIEQGLSTPADVLKALNGLAAGDAGESKTLIDSLVSRLGPQKIPFEMALNYKTFQHKPISDKDGPQAGLEPAPKIAKDLPPSLKKLLDVQVGADGTVFWSAGADYALNNVPYGKAAGDITTPKSEANQYGQSPLQSGIAALGVKTSSFDVERIQLQQAYTSRDKVDVKIARAQRLKTAWKQLTPHRRVPTKEYAALLKEQKQYQDIIDAANGKTEQITMPRPLTREEERAKYLKERKDYNPKTEREKYKEKRRAERLLRNGGG